VLGDCCYALKTTERACIDYIDTSEWLWLGSRSIIVQRYPMRIDIKIQCNMLYIVCIINILFRIQVRLSIDEETSCSEDAETYWKWLA